MAGSIYAWFPSIDGKLSFDVPGSGSEISADASDILDNPEMTLMGTYVAKRDRWSLMGDLIYLHLDNTETSQINIGPGPGLPLDVKLEANLKAWVVSAAVGYELLANNNGELNAIGGLRYVSMDVDASLTPDGPLPPSLPSTELGNKETLWDGIVGVKGNIRLSERWYLPYYADIGAGDSELTWQAMAGVGYQFDWGDLRFAYRHLEIDQKSGSMIQDLSFSGPAIGVAFRF